VITVDVTGVESLQRDLDRAGKQLPFALALALTRTAQVGQHEIKSEMRRVFNRPTPYTLRSVYLKPATKRKLESDVWLKDDAYKGLPATKYLGPQVFGGERNHKRFEQLMRAKGYLPPGLFVVPAEGAKLDAYGNLSRGQLQRILAQLQASFDPLQRETPTSRKRQSRRKTRGGRYVLGGVGRAKHLKPGVWERITTGFGSAIRPVLLFVRRPRYQQRLEFFGVLERVGRDQLPYQLSQAVDLALRTAKL
jgi:hypothetical protein